MSKELWKIHVPRRGKTGSGARPRGYLEVVGMYLGERRRAESAHTAAASRWRRPYHAGAWSERTSCAANRDVLPRRRRMEKRCTSSLSAGGRDAAGSVTNGERERPPQPCVRYSEERPTRQGGSILYSGADYLFLHKNRFIFCVRAIERYNFI